jgi:hypothetical protein
MAIGSFFILKHYLDFLDMSIPLDVACTSFLTPNPLPRPRYLALILPFHYQLWLLVLSICLIFAPVGLHFLTKMAVHATEYRIFSGWSSILCTSVSIMSQVALHLWPRFWPVRMFIGWYWLFCLLVSLAYRGAMVSFLSIPLFEDPIDNLHGLDASKLRIGGWGTELRNLFVQKGAVNEHGVKALLSQKYEVSCNSLSLLFLPKLATNAHLARGAHFHSFRFTYNSNSICILSFKSKATLSKLWSSANFYFLYKKTLCLRSSCVNVCSSCSTDYTSVTNRLIYSVAGFCVMKWSSF